MSKKKGLSFEEKRDRMLEVFYNHKDVFQLKDLEKICPKEKGIIAQSVKEVLTSLCDDGLVDTEKVGTSVYFWAFPSKALNLRKRKLEELEEKLSTLKRKKEVAVKQLAEAKVGKEDSDERTQAVQQLQAKRKEKEEIDAELLRLRDCDPQHLKEMQKENLVAIEASNRWTDNVFALRPWCRNKFNIEENQFNKQFDVPDDFDYIDS